MCKSQSDRVRECLGIRQQLLDYGILAPPQLVDAMNVFVRDGIASTDTVFVPRAGRVLEYCLSTKTPSTAVLRAPRSNFGLS